MARSSTSLKRILGDVGVEFAYVVAREPGGTAVRHELCRRVDDRRLFAHPRQWRQAQASGFREAPLARALCPPGAAEPLHIIDATAGLGGTALRIAHTFGCRVTAVEVSAPLACLLEYGMRSLAAQQAKIDEAQARLDSINELQKAREDRLANLADLEEKIETLELYEKTILESLNAGGYNAYERTTNQREVAKVQQRVAELKVRLLQETDAARVKKNEDAARRKHADIKWAR